MQFRFSVNWIALSTHCIVRFGARATSKRMTTRNLNESSSVILGRYFVANGAVPDVLIVADANAIEMTFGVITDRHNGKASSIKVSQLGNTWEALKIRSIAYVRHSSIKTPFTFRRRLVSLWRSTIQNGRDPQTKDRTMGSRWLLVFAIARSIIAVTIRTSIIII